MRLFPLLCIPLVTTPLAGQVKLEEIRGAPKCSNCLVAEKVATLNALQDKGTVEFTRDMTRDSKGNLYIAAMSTPGEIHQYSPRGSFVRTIGRMGKGPGEFQLIRAVRTMPGDSLLVFDAGAMSFTVLDPKMKYVRSIKTPLMMISENGAWVGHGNLIVNADVRSREQAGKPLHILPLNGSGDLRSFGDLGGYRADLMYSTWRQIAPTRDGFWSLHTNRYELEFWDYAMKQKRHIKRVANWFEPWWEWADPLKSLPTRPNSAGLNLDGNGYLWVAVELPAGNQKKYLEANSKVERGSWHWTSHEKPFDTMIEIIDPKTRSVLAALRMDDRIAAALGNGYYATYREGRSGKPILDVWHLRLRGAPSTN